MMKLFSKKIIPAFVLFAYLASCAVSLFQPVPVTIFAEDLEAAVQDKIHVDRKETERYDLPVYSDYLGALPMSKEPTAPIPIDVEKSLEGSSPDAVFGTYTDADQKTGDGLYTSDTGEVSWAMDVPEEGLYHIRMTYFPAPGKGSSIVRSVSINGEIPFREAQAITLHRTFLDHGKMTRDASGNDIRPVQVEAPTWQDVYLSDSLGYYNQPLLFHFRQGRNVLTLTSIREPLVIGSITLCREEERPAYAEKYADYENHGYVPASKAWILIEGENATRKSDRMLYPISDNSSPLTSPSSTTEKRLNTIGGYRWQIPGQWIEWEFDVEEAGLYVLAIKARQNLISGKPSYRQISINGEIPYIGLEETKFAYSNQWALYFPGSQSTDPATSGNPTDPQASLDRYVYLDKGRNVIRMEAVTGELAPLVQEVRRSLEVLNAVYLDLLMYIGPSPDIYRDYQFDVRMPDTLKTLLQESRSLSAIAENYEKVQGESGPYSQQLRNFARMLQKMHRDPDKIAPYFNDFINNISSLGTWINTILNQPLEIDYILLASSDAPFPETTPGAMQQFSYMFRQFIASFFVDYNAIGGDGNASSDVTVWMSAGRDQANSLNQLILNGLSPTEGIRVKLELVPASTLLPATLAGKGPDVALNCGQSDPLNYAIRGAVQDLSLFLDSAKIEERFTDSALEPLKFNEALFGLPETQAFPILFYRKDILDMLDIDVPETWDDVIGILPILQKNSMNFGLPQPYISNITGAGFSTFSMFLFQLDGELYNDKGDAALLDREEAIDAFFTWTKFYNEQSLPVSYDFVSRFRSGEIPIGIADYSMYNILSVFAPELHGIWGFGKVPGTQARDGSINHTVASTVTASIMMSGARDVQASWKFMKWWTSADVQNAYGNEIESIMGTAGRYQTANIDAFYNIPWSSADFLLLSEQWKDTKGIREIPGSYMTPRYVDFAFKQAFTGTTDMTLSALIDPGEIIQKASKLIDEEIRYKRLEFALD
jgi:ABC-type glycerol-3-phosphate transport system substrate-binding protein